MSADVEPGRRFGHGALLTPANVLTTTRLVAAFPILWWMHATGAGWGVVAAWFLVTASDLADGWLARREGATASGAFLDPVVDKVLVLGAFAVLADRGDLPWWPFWVIGSREVGVSLFRSLAARRGVSLPARRLGKYKTFAQNTAIGLVVLPLTADLHGVHDVFVWLAVVLTVVSGVDLVAHARRDDPTGSAPPEVRR